MTEESKGKSGGEDTDAKGRHRIEELSKVNPAFLMRGRPGTPAPPATFEDARIGRIVQYWRFITTVLVDDNEFSRYIESHPQKVQLRRRLRARLRTKRKEIAIALGREARPHGPDAGGKPGTHRDATTPTLGDYRQYLAMMPAEIPKAFAEFPDAPNVCELWRLIQDVLEAVHNGKQIDPEVLEALDMLWRVKGHALREKWYAVTGTETTDRFPAPRLGELLKRIAPLPRNPAWSKDAFLKEGRAPHASLPEAGPFHGGSQEQSESSGRNTRTRAARSADETATGAGEPTAGPDAICTGCDPAAWISRAGGRPLQTPTQPDSSAIYSFPQELRRGEDIFYDYSLVLPIVDCEDDKQDSTEQAVSLLAAKALAAQARSVILFLQQTNLAHTLGRYNSGTDVVDQIDTLLSEVDALPGAGTPDQQARRTIDLTRRINELAGVVYTNSRHRLFISELASTDPRVHEAALTTAIDNINNLNLHAVSRKVPTSSESASYGSVMEAVTNTNGILYTEPADNNGWFSSGWYFTHKQQREDLKPYLKWFGGTLYSRLDTLVQRATAMRNAVANFGGGYEAFLRDFERMASELVENAAQVLASVLRDLTQCLPVPLVERRPASKRLGLQVVFRQYWFPEGYVQGKLVGYKNLIPKERQEIKRRTFVKTVRETTTATEFAHTRQDDFSLTQRESAELTRESALKFGFSTSASGDFQIGLANLGFEMQTDLSMSETTKTAQSRIAESIMKTSVSYNEKREVKVRELTETEDMHEATITLENANQEITANYFYYQLLRQYCVRTELHDIRPVLLRTRELPTPAEVNDRFISRYIHILALALPAQLSIDAQETINDIELLAATMLRTRANADVHAVAYDRFLAQQVPTDPAELTRWRDQVRQKEERMRETEQAYVDANEKYTRARTRLDRVVTHVQDNIAYYMQFIWQASPRTDHDMLLRSETFRGRPLPEVTRGLIKIGYQGNEEIFEYDGESIALIDRLLDHLTLVDGADEGQENGGAVSESNLMDQLMQHYCVADRTELEALLDNHAFVESPVPADTVLSKRSIQVAQDALVVEAMPGQVPLLEGYKMAHRMLDVQKSCLENYHLCARISDSPWTSEGSVDNYEVVREEGE